MSAPDALLRDGERWAAALRRGGQPDAADVMERLMALVGTPPEPPQPFGDPNGPAWQRGELHFTEPRERYVEMACCGFRFSADHEDDGEPRGRYSCPMCSDSTPPEPSPSGPLDAAALQAATDAYVYSVTAGAPEFMEHERAILAEGVRAAVRAYLGVAPRAHVAALADDWEHDANVVEQRHGVEHPGAIAGAATLRACASGLRAALGGGAPAGAPDWIATLPPDAIASVVNAYRDAYDAYLQASHVGASGVDAHAEGCRWFRDALLSVAPRGVPAEGPPLGPWLIGSYKNPKRPAPNWSVHNTETGTMWSCDSQITQTEAEAVRDALNKVSQESSK